MYKELFVNLLSKGFEASSWAFSVNQRRWLAKRDERFGVKSNKGTCQAPVPNHKCNGDRKVEEHHIIPQGYSAKVGVNPDVPTNGLTVCENFHRKNKDVVIHPDAEEALAEYRKGDKQSFEKLRVTREAKMEERVIYWNPDYDRGMTVIALRNTQRAEKAGFSPFPAKEVRKNGHK